MVSLLYTVSTAEGGRVAWLEDLVVDPSYRGRGIGKSLLRFVIAYGRKKGLKRITLLTDMDNRKAKALYKSHGFKSSGMTPLRLSL
jgi:ribosomal protein S18 acetylase RimI-like enzyme